MNRDPVREYTDYLEEQEERIEHLPECECCGYKIQQESAVHIDGKWYCDECIDESRRSLEDYE